jgi:hypothetical protein
VALSPSQTIIQAAYAEKTVTDSLGRVLKWRNLKALDRARIFKAAGPTNAQNPPYIGLAMIACSCTSVDDVPLPFPTKESEIDAAIARLDDPGMDAIATEMANEMAEKEKVDGDGASPANPTAQPAATAA